MKKYYKIKRVNRYDEQKNIISFYYAVFFFDRMMCTAQSRRMAEIRLREDLKRVRT